MSASPQTSTKRLLERGVEFVRSPLFFRVWAIWGSILMSMWAMYALYFLSWVMQPIYCSLLFATWFTSSKDVCSRCRHRGTWHCGGQGMLVERLFPERKGPVSVEEYRLHGMLLCLLAGFTLFALFYHHVFSGLFGVGWLSLVVLAALPADGSFSWYIGLAETRRRAEESAKERTKPVDAEGTLELDTAPQNEEPEKKVLHDAPWDPDLEASGGIEIIPLDGSERAELKDFVAESQADEPSTALPYADFGFEERAPKEPSDT